MSLEVATYKPQNGNVSHWTLVLTDESEITTLYEVIGAPTEFRRNTMHSKDPKSSSRFTGLVWVSHVDDIVEAKRILEQQPIRNDIATWSCQDFVLEALEALSNELLIEDYDYQAARERLEHMYYE
jgi:hypothetical protein